jgi:hypothetical protein
MAKFPDIKLTITTEDVEWLKAELAVALAECERLRNQLDGQAHTIKKHRATWMVILKDRRGWREAARVERERHIVWEERFEEERKRAEAWRACADRLAAHLQDDDYHGPTGTENCYHCPVCAALEEYKSLKGQP